MGYAHQSKPDYRRRVRHERGREMTEQTTETTESPMDLSFLSNVKATKATIATVPRGRKAAPNPVAGHYQASLDTLDADGFGDTSSLKVTAGVAPRVEGLLRKAAGDCRDGQGYGVSIQMQLAAKVKDAATETVSLEGVKELEPETPVWVAFRAQPKQVQNRKPKTDESTESPADESAE